MRAPTPPDPYEQANAQAGANRDAAVSGAIINNVDESNPFGSVTYTRRGDETYIDAQGKRVTVPRYRRDVTLSEEQQALYDRQTQAGINLGDLAVSQSERLNNVLNEPFDPQGLPDRARSDGMRTNVGLQRDRNQFGYRGPGVRQNVNLEGQRRDAGYRGPGVQTNSGATIGDAGPVQRNIGPSDYSADRTRVEDAMMARYDRMDAKTREAQEAKLMNQGLTPGSNAWNDRMDELNRSRNDARTKAILAGGQEQSRLAGLELSRGDFSNRAQQQEFGQDQARGLFALQRMGAENAAQNQSYGQNLSNKAFEREGVSLDNASRLQEAGFANQAQQQAFGQHGVARNYNRSGIALNNQTALQEAGFANDAIGRKAALDANIRQQALQEAFAMRNQPINEITSLMSGSQVTAPKFDPAYRQAVQSAPIGDYMQQNYNARLANHQAGLSGLFGLGSSLIGGLFGLSDRRLKDSVSLMAKLANGLGLYLFRYRHSGQWSVGVMAQDVAQIIPNVVRSMGGVMSVDYGEVTKCMAPA